MRRSLLVTWGLLAIAATVVLAVAGLTLHPVAKWLAAVIVGASAGGDKLVQAFRRKWHTRRSDITDALKAALVQIHRETSLPLFDLGVHAFRKGRKWRWRWPPIQSELLRVGQYSLLTRPRSNIHWTRGKGVIGKLWEEDVPYFGMELSSLRSIEASEAWVKSGAEGQTGLSLPEFRKTDQYSSVVAVPIQDDKASFIGCVSVDGPEGCLDALRDARQALHDASKAIREIVRRKED